MIKENIIVKMKFGSHLYGTNTFESDIDYKGIFLPTKEQVILGKIPNSYKISTSHDNIKNTKEDIDTEIYSLHYFMKIACEGQTAPIEMLNAPDNMLIETSPIWDSIVNNREKFYSKNMKAFVGYARSQASKYGFDENRINSAKKILQFLLYYDENIRLSSIWSELPTDKYIQFLENGVNNIRRYQVCGKIIQETVTIKYAKEVIQLIFKSYKKKDIDWKPVSHTIRVISQLKELLENKNINFPLKNAELIKKIKTGNFDYHLIIAPLLEDLMHQVELLVSKSDLPKKVDKSFWDTFICNVICWEYGISPFDGEKNINEFWY